MLREGQVRIPAGCAISGIFHRDGTREDGTRIMQSIKVMHDRSNGLGGGFAGYGIYPEYKDYYALHVFFDTQEARVACEAFLDRHFDIVNLSKIPTRRHPRIVDEPMIWRYFVRPLHVKLEASQLDEREYVARCVIRVNDQIDGAYIFSSGKNMGVFKAVGYPEDVGAFYRLEEYKAYCWTCHGRYPTNTPAGGAVPIPSRCSTPRSCTTVKSRPTTPTAARLRCLATSATCRPTPRLSLILSITLAVSWA